MSDLKSKPCQAQISLWQKHVNLQMRAKTGDQTISSSTGDDSLEALNKYGQDLTAQVAHLDPVIGRDEEIRRVIRILCRRTKNNPVLIGEPGESFASR